MKYRKKPVVIEAFRFGHDNIPDWFRKALDDNYIEIESIPSFFGSTSFVKIYTLEGTMEAHVGDYIIKGIQGELYPCKPKIFEETYELVSE